LSAWSNIVNVYVPLAGQIKKIFAQDDILAVHRSLIRLCAARGDLTASLSLPQHFRENDAISYVKVLKSSLVQSKTAEVVVPPLTNSEANAFSYTFLFHPWVISRRIEGKGEFVAIPPDGAICGMIARRSLSRGAWLAPANELLSGVVALTPPLLRESRLSFLEAQINLIRQEPRGFTTLSADTLCDDRDLRPINVRRLLILVRKQALKKGAEYVFEPNDAVFRRMVQRGFEAMLDDMFMRGAFSGATPATAYQVVAGSSLNSPLSMEQGRFIVELKVSPSNPMSFLTIRLLQTGDRMSVSEGH
jgi:phage tail sheath protein FI